MKAVNRSIIAAAAVLGVSAFVTSAASASDGTITITGRITGQTCTITTNAANGNVTVQLPTVQTTAFTAAGSTAGRTGFSIALTNCTPTTGNVSAFFEQGPTIDTVTGNLINEATTGAATNVQVQLLNATDPTTTHLNLSQLPGAQGATLVAITAGAATLNYAAQYVAVNGIPTLGPVSTTVVYSLNYQ